MVKIRQPIFFVGMGRSGTTVIWESFAAHPDLAWFSQYLARLPRFPVVAALSRVADWSPSMRQATSRSDELHSWLERLRVGPVEATAVWRRCCGRDFAYSYLLGVQATAAERRRLQHMVSRVLRYQGKSRFAAKITGPARLGYLVSIFPDARFIQVVRDGRAVVRSLMRVPFWRDTWRMNRPAWRGGLGDRELAQWEGYDRSPLALAAIQWRAVVRSTRQEATRFAPARYGEVRYEDFIADPHTALDELAVFCNLGSSQAPHEFLEKRIEFRDMNVQWRPDFTGDELQMLNEVMGDTLEELGYGSAPARPHAGEELVRTPLMPARALAGQTRKPPDEGSITEGERPAAADWEIPKPKGSMYYLAKQWAHRRQAARARRASRGHDPWKSGLRIMAYHRISTDRDELAVTPVAFRAQMEALLRVGAHPVRIDEALDLVEERPAGRYVCVTFDDGYHDNLDNAIPVLRDLQIPATIFVPTRIIDGTARPYWYKHPPPMFSWSELREVSQDDLFAIGAHTRTHPALPKLSDDAAWSEIEGSKRDVEVHTDQRTSAFAYPAGLYGEREIRMVREAGYRLGVTVEPGLIGPGHRPQTLHRSFIDRRDNLHTFEAKLTGLLDAPWGLGNVRTLPPWLRRLGRRSADGRGTSERAHEDRPTSGHR